MFGGMGGSMTDLLAMMGMGGGGPPVTPQSQGQALGTNPAMEAAMQRGGGMPPPSGFVGNQTEQLRSFGPVGQGPGSQAPMDMYQRDIAKAQGGIDPAAGSGMSPEAMGLAQKAIKDMTGAISKAPQRKAPPPPKQGPIPQLRQIPGLSALTGASNAVDPMQFLNQFQQANAGGGGPAQLQALLAQMMAGRR